MIIADMISNEPGHPRVGRVYLSTAPFPGDTLRCSKGEFTVLRRTFLDLGPSHESGLGTDNVLSLELKVRPS